jgi:methyl-accepting chemotaxis protein
MATIRDMTHQIAAAAEEQTTVSEEINQNVVRVVEISAETSGYAEHSETAGQTVADLALEMQGMAKAFYTGEKGLDLEEAKSAHMAWRTKLRHFLDGQSVLTHDQATSHKHCVLGGWYYGEGLQHYAHIPEMQQVEAPHKEMHDLVREIITLKQANRTEEAEKAYWRVVELSDEIVALLDAIERKAAHEAA